MRSGFTTGSYAAAAAKAAAAYLLRGKKYGRVRLVLPDGGETFFEAEQEPAGKAEVCFSVLKDAGDDPDVTNGMKILASAKMTDDPGVEIRGGEGVGTVTKPGLDQPAGEYAINSVPRRMITDAVQEEMVSSGYKGGLIITISIPGGREKAKETMNPILGIEGGLSILGTSGRVHPMSRQAMIDTIRVQIRQQTALGYRTILMAPGNYGADFLTENYGVPADRIVKISNFVGASLDAARDCGATGIVLAGHIGKMIKVAGGIMNTYSKNADARLEILSALALKNGAPAETVRNMLNEVTTDGALSYLAGDPSFKNTMQSVADRAAFYMERRTTKDVRCHVILFSNVYGLLAATEGAGEALKAALAESRE